MASILKVDELQGIATAGDITVTSEGGAVTQSLQQGLAKQFIDFDMAGTTPRDSLNLSSLTDSATGRFHATATAAFSSVNYPVNYTNNGYPGDTWDVDQITVAKINWNTAITTTKYDMVSYSTTGYLDGKYNYITTFGDLA